MKFSKRISILLVACMLINSVAFMPVTAFADEAYTKTEMQYVDTDLDTEPVECADMFDFTEEPCIGDVEEILEIESEDDTVTGQAVESTVAVTLTAASETPLCFTANTAESKVTLTNSGTGATWDNGVYSTDGTNWLPYSLGTEKTLVHAGDTIYFKGNLSNTGTGYLQFVITGSVAASGNIMSLGKGDGFSTADAIPENGYFQRLFEGCTGLTTAPELPATGLRNNCYQYMFAGCTGLTSVPSFSATSLALKCCFHMFDGCTSLTSVPALPAKKLANYCYQYMFNGCESLESAPALPAETLTEGCYSNMFKGCTKLENAPVLPATTLANYCYSNMFNGCTKLESAPALPAGTMNEGCYQGMFKDCTGLTKIPALPATNLMSNCYYEMFSGCTGICVSEVMDGDYKIKWSLPDGVTAPGGAVAVLDNMFAGTGGTFTGTPEPFTAYYTKASDCTVTFVTEKGTAPAPVQVLGGEKVDKPTDPTADGYTFVGWYMDAACTNAWDFDKDTVTDNNVTLFAKWKFTTIMALDEEGSELTVNEGKKPKLKFTITVGEDLCDFLIKLIDGDGETWATGVVSEFETGSYEYFGYEKEPGTYQLTAVFEGDGDYAQSKCQFNLVIKGKADTTLVVDEDDSVLKFDKGEIAYPTFILAAGDVKLEDKKITVKSSKDGETVAEGTATQFRERDSFIATNHYKAGTYSFTATFAGDDEFKESSCNFTVVIAGTDVKSIEITNYNEFTVHEGMDGSIEVSIEPFDADIKSIEWEFDENFKEIVDYTISDDKTYVLVTGKKAGTGMITVIVSDWSGSDPIMDKKEFTVIGDEKYTVTFDANGHGVAPAAQTVAKWDKADKPADLSEEGYVFGGWYKEKECKTAWDFESDLVFADVTIYAKWTKAGEQKKVTGVEITNNNGFSVHVGMLTFVDVKIVPSDADVESIEWEFDDSLTEAARCTISDDRMFVIVTGKKAGTGMISVTVKDQAGSQPIKKQKGFTVIEKEDPTPVSEPDDDYENNAIQPVTPIDNASSISASWTQDENGTWRAKYSGAEIKNEFAHISLNGQSCWYHFNDEGKMDTGWVNAGGAWYFMSETHDGYFGSMQTGWHIDASDGYTYYLGSDGRMLTGWNFINGSWYYFNTATTAQTWALVDGKWTFVNASSIPLGAMLTNATTPDGYRVDATGKWIQ